MDLVAVPRRECAVPISAFLDRKLERRFRTYDLDGDGILTESDFAGAVHRVNEVFGMDDADPKSRSLRETLTGLWRTLAGYADSDGDGRLTLDEHIKWYVSVLSIPADEATEIFHLLDRDGSGYLTGQEMSRAVFEYYFSEDRQSAGSRMLGKIE
ncbi:hypothetical protein D5S17_03280 [Pseudonocardiaceae bacterium YIM PH 21723]|nr:hypothetical protein D5S17_03280 [Pseudonocardiaceae bacterium YIM PH 21723]